MKHLLLLFLFIVTASGLHAQTDSLDAKILRLLEVSGAEQMFISTAMNMIDMQQGQPAYDAVPDTWFAEFRKRIQDNGWSSIAPELARIYREQYTEEEIDYLIDYHQNPLSRQIMAKQPAVQRESMEVGRIWGERIATEMAEQLEHTSEGN